MLTGMYVVVALFNFGTYPVFTELVGVAWNSPVAFELLDKYDCEKVIASKYEMTITEKMDRLKRDFGKTDAKKMYYEERRQFTYQIKDDDEKHLVDVTFTIYEV